VPTIVVIVYILRSLQAGEPLASSSAPTTLAEASHPTEQGSILAVDSPSNRGSRPWGRCWPGDSSPAFTRVHPSRRTTRSPTRRTNIYKPLGSTGDPRCSVDRSGCGVDRGCRISEGGGYGPLSSRSARGRSPFVGFCQMLSSIFGWIFLVPALARWPSRSSRLSPCPVAGGPQGRRPTIPLHKWPGAHRRGRVAPCSPSAVLLFLGWTENGGRGLTDETMNAKPLDDPSRRCQIHPDPSPRLSRFAARGRSLLRREGPSFPRAVPQLAQITPHCASILRSLVCISWPAENASTKKTNRATSRRPSCDPYYAAAFTHVPCPPAPCSTRNPSEIQSPEQAAATRSPLTYSYSLP